jgi:hypothetical protein
MPAKRHWRVRICISALLACFSTVASAAWVKFSENERLTAFYDEAIPKGGGITVVWVMFDYKAVQTSPRSGRVYSSQKGQHEVDCQAARSRTAFFTWHEGHMGDGRIVYTGSTPLPWEPNSPNSIARALSLSICPKR